MPEGTLVRIKWSGGNGPFEYVVGVDKYENRFVRTVRDAERNVFPNPPLWLNPLDIEWLEEVKTGLRYK